MRVGVIGLGQAGGRVADLITYHSVYGMARDTVPFSLAINTAEADLRSLKTITAEDRVLIGVSQVRGHGVGLIREVAAAIATDSLPAIMRAIVRKNLEYIDAFWLIAGFGGGTGSGCIPIVARRLKELYEQPVYVIGLLPTRDEGRKMNENAVACLRELYPIVDGILIFDNDQWRKEQRPKEWQEEQANLLDDAAFIKILQACMGKLPGNWMAAVQLKYLEEKKLEGIKAELIEKAKKLKAKISGEQGTEELKKKVAIKKRIDMLIPLEDYIRSGIYIGTRVVTPQMRQFVYRRRADGLAIFNTDLIDEKLREGIEFLSHFDAKDIIMVCKRHAGWKAAEKFSEITGIRVFIGRYPPGLLTNLALENFTETKIMLVTDPWPDKNAVNDAVRVGIPIIALCDTNNTANNVDLIVPCNNKGKKSLGLIFWIIAKEYLKNRGVIKKDEDLKVTVDDFTPD